VFCAVVETTEKVIEERRLRLLNALAEATQARSKEDACAAAAAHLVRFPNDLPFALVYLVDAPSSSCRARAKAIRSSAASGPSLPRRAAGGHRDARRRGEAAARIRRTQVGQNRSLSFCGACAQAFEG
jgi:hypothetical protein